jgi:asparagine synthase (glutamine-hydrolysing)
MCRIFGHFGGPMAENQLRTLSALQRHGGPDEQSYLVRAGWSLGNNRLSIVDLDHGHQPYSLGKDIHVVFNGEIYNHDELRKRLRIEGYVFQDRCDGSILPALYHHYGAEFVEHLDGMFAIAVVDLRGEPRLLLATDDAGMKPLYYHERNGQITFSSELPALLTMPGVSWRPWLPGLDAYLTTKTPFGEQTMIEGVKVLPRATTAIRTDESGLVLRRRQAHHHRTMGFRELDEAGDALRELLRAETGRLTLADVPVSAITSGGLDSSLVTALVAEDVPHVNTFNIAYRGDWPFDERHFARETAQLYGTRHHQVEADPEDFPKLLGDVVWHLGQPNADPITVSTYALFREVGDAGFKVALTGDAADEIFGGYDRIRRAVAAGPEWVDDYVAALAAVPAELRHRLYSADYRYFLDENGTEEQRLQRMLSEPGTDRLGTVTGFEVDQRLPAYHLRRVDHLSMAHSVEVRLPFCQRAVTQFALHLPSEFRVSDKEVKRVLYRAGAGLLPESVLNRPKQPFTLPITAMLRAGSTLMNFAREVLSDRQLAVEGLLNPKAVNQLFEEQIERPSDTGALALWSLLVHRLWAAQLGTAHTTVDPIHVGTAAAAAERAA